MNSSDAQPGGAEARREPQGGAADEGVDSGTRGRSASRSAFFIILGGVGVLAGAALRAGVISGGIHAAAGIMLLAGLVVLLRQLFADATVVRSACAFLAGASLGAAQLARVFDDRIDLFGVIQWIVAYGVALVFAWVGFATDRAAGRKVLVYLGAALGALALLLATVGHVVWPLVGDPICHVATRYLWWLGRLLGVYLMDVRTWLISLPVTLGFGTLMLLRGGCSRTATRGALVLRAAAMVVGIVPAGAAPLVWWAFDLRHAAIRLSGSERYVYQLALVDGPASADTLDQTLGVLRRRLDPGGYKGVRVTAENDSTIRVDTLPGYGYFEPLVGELCVSPGVIEFRVAAEPDPNTPSRWDAMRQRLRETGARRAAGDTVGWFRIWRPVAFFNFATAAELQNYRPEADRTYVIEKRHGKYYVLAELGTQLGMPHDPGWPWSVRKARLDRDEHKRWSVSLELDEAGADLFEQLTRSNVGRSLCVLVDGEAISAPSIRGPIRAHAQITGDFSLEKVLLLVQLLDAPPLPVRLRLIGQHATEPH
jgi:hypothetical protein